MIIELRQNSPEWTKWREGGIGSSDAPVIMDESDYSSPYELWQRKTGRRAEAKDDRVKQGGRTDEDNARDAYALETGNLLPAACFAHDQHNFIRWSADGYSYNLGLGLEIKCPQESIRDHLIAKSGEIPGHYYAQVQHALLFVPRLHYWSWWQGEGVLLEVLPHPDYQAKLLAAEKLFWDWVQNDSYPMPKGEQKITDPAIIQRFELWTRSKHHLDEAVAAEEYARRLLRAATSGYAKSFFGDLGVCTWSQRKGNVKYSEIPAIEEMGAKALDEYRGPGSLTFTPKRLK